LERRAAGAFYTPPEIVGPMVRWALEARPQRFVDPGCGSGRFAAAAARLDASLEIIAVDLDPLATLVTRSTLAALGVKKADVRCESFLTLELPPAAGRTAWVGNPPYVRHHDLGSDVKAWAVDAAKLAGQSISGLAGLHALFFLAITLQAKTGDVGAMVTSAEWLDVGYGSIVRKLFTDGMGGRALDLVDPRAVPFEDAMTTALITCFEIGRRPTEVAVRLAETPADLQGLEVGRMVPAEELRAANRWSFLFRAPVQAPAPTGRRLGDIARVHRGYVTGDNGFFLMTREEAEARGLAEFCTPTITSASEILGSDGVIRDTTSLKVVLDLPSDFDRASHPAVDAYLSTGEARGVDKRYICSHRSPWWRVGTGKRPPIVASYMARQAPRFARNPDGVALLNIGHGIHRRVEMTAEELDELASALNEARAGFAGSGRTYHGGLEKFEPREMEALLIPE
jgi:methylase of polypeptide subunit release factors